MQCVCCIDKAKATYITKFIRIYIYWRFILYFILFYINTSMYVDFLIFFFIFYFIRIIFFYSFIYIRFEQIFFMWVVLFIIHFYLIQQLFCVCVCVRDIRTNTKKLFFLLLIFNCLISSAISPLYEYNFST